MIVGQTNPIHQTERIIVMKGFYDKLHAIADKMRADNYSIVGGDRSNASKMLENAIGSVFTYMNAKSQAKIMPGLNKTIGITGQEYFDANQRYAENLEASKTDLINAMHPMNVIYESMNESETFFDTEHCPASAIAFTSEVVGLVSDEEAERNASYVRGARPYDREANTRRIIENILPEDDDQSYQL